MSIRRYRCDKAIKKRRFKYGWKYNYFQGTTLSQFAYDIPFSHASSFVVGGLRVHYFKKNCKLYQEFK